MHWVEQSAMTVKFPGFFLRRDDFSKIRRRILAYIKAFFKWCSSAAFGGVGSSGENPGQSLKRPWPASVFYSWVASLAMPFREWKVSWNGESEDDLVAPAPSLSHNIYTLQNALLLNFSMWKNHYTNARNHFLPTLFITCNITSVDQLMVLTKRKSCLVSMHDMRLVTWTLLR